MPESRSNDAGTWRFVVARLAFAVAVLFAATTAVFLLFALIPADATADTLGLQANAETRAQLSRELGLDQPLIDRYLRYLGNLAHGNLGRSFAGLGDVTPLVWVRLTRTLPLVLSAALAALLLGVSLALAITWLDRPGIYRLADALSLALASMPVFVTALVLTITFGRDTTVSVIYDGTWRSAVLPIAALSVAPTFWVTRVVSTDVRRILSQNFILFRRGLGLSKIALFLTAFRNVSLLVALGTNITLALLLGSFFVEYAFNWPGLGQLLVYSLLRRDAPVVQGGVLCVAAVILFVDLVVETARRSREVAR